MDLEALQAVVQSSFLGAIPQTTRDRLLEGTSILKFSAGQAIFRADDRPRRGGLVVSGLVRVFLSTLDGRQATVRYARPGLSVGIVSALFGGTRANVQAAADSSILELDMATLQAGARTDVNVAYAIAEEVSRRLTDSLAEISSNTFGSTRHRVARHLLDLATEEQNDGLPFVPMTQSQLAADVGSVREVVSRILGDFRDSRLIETQRRRIILLNVRALAAVLTDRKKT